jgi:hypothetical protein
LTPTQAKVGISLAALLWAWLMGRRAKAATGDVDIGTPTVTGPGSDQFGGEDYGTTPAPAFFLPDQSPFRIAEPTPLADIPERPVE